MSKKTLIAGLVLFAGAPVMAQVNEVDPQVGLQIAPPAAVNPGATDAPIVAGSPIDLPSVEYHASARVTGGNQVFRFDDLGNMIGQYDQITGAITDAWGYRDGATDGTFIYFGWGGGVARHDADGSNGVLQFNGLNCPGTCRALAFDPTGDGGRGSFWTISFGSDLIELDMLGNEINFFFNGGWSVYGMSFDDTDGNLWAHDGLGDIIKIDTTTGIIMPPNPMWTVGAFSGFAAQGGLSGFSELGGNLAAVSQGAPDSGGVYDTAASLAAGVGVFAAGPWTWETTTGSNGHLGIAVIAASACPCACDWDVAPICDIFDFLAFQTAFVAGEDCACLFDPDPICDIFDFLAFQTQFVQGCP